MDTDSRSERAAVIALVAGISFLLATACARTSVQDVRVMASGLPRPSVVLVHPFAASGGVVALSGGLISRAMEAVENTPEAQQREQVAQQVTQVLAQKLVKRIQDLGLPAELAAAAAPAGSSTLSIEGQILSIDEGNPTRRMIIGLGAGSTVEGDAEAAAKAIAKQLSSFFFQQGWIPPGMEE